MVASVEEACTNGSLEAVERNLEQSVQQMPKDQINMRHFSGALRNAYSGSVNMPILSYLLSKGVPASVSDFTFAARNQYYELMELFLEHGYDINSSMDMNCPPALSTAIRDKPLAEWLLSHGADPNAETGPWDMTPLSFAVHNGTFEVVRLFFEHGGSVEHGQLLHHAVLRDTPDCAAMVSYLLDQGAPINETMYQNRPDNLVRFWYGRPGTALQRAAELGKWEVVNLLLERGADPSIRDNHGRLPVETAEEFGQDEVVERLRQCSRLDDGSV